MFAYLIYIKVGIRYVIMYYIIADCVGRAPGQRRRADHGLPGADAALFISIYLSLSLYIYIYVYT